jgi:hypothetical protein
MTEIKNTEAVLEKNYEDGLSEYGKKYRDRMNKTIEDGFKKQVGDRVQAVSVFNDDYNVELIAVVTYVDGQVEVYQTGISYEDAPEFYQMKEGREGTPIIVQLPEYDVGQD